jgi:hypothetical protein
MLRITCHDGYDPNASAIDMRAQDFPPLHSRAGISRDARQAR